MDDNLQYYVFITLLDSTGEKSVKKLLFQVENWSLQEIHSLHTNYKKLISFRLNKEHPGISPSH
jgi:hypothetical protein